MAKHTRIDSVYDGLLESVRRIDNFSKLESQVKESSNTVVFKMRHKPTGLFAKSALPEYRGLDNDCTKLSVGGKIYVKAPNLPNDVFRVIYPRKFDASGFDEVSEPNDWELVSYELKEIK
ncbi:Hypothetical protein DAL_126 [Psychrobacter phage D'Alembert]|nr:Hypothetical protein DAL_126 [Psychrobacter phage D'Alembert]